MRRGGSGTSNGCRLGSELAAESKVSLTALTVNPPADGHRLLTLHSCRPGPGNLLRAQAIPLQRILPIAA
jgi:hypothetical protein